MEKDQEKLIIQSDQEWIGYLIGKIFSIVISVVLICVMLIYFVLTDIMRTKQDVQKLIFMLTILVLLVLSNIYRYWRNIGRVLILDKTGVLAKMWFYKKKYKWSDLKINIKTFKRISYIKKFTVTILFRLIIIRSKKYSLFIILP